MPDIDLAQPIGALAVALPGATAVFRRHKLDFCCGGSVSLAEAAAARALDPAAIAAELAMLAPAEAEMPADPAGLVALIVSRFHAGHRRELPELIRLSQRVEAVHRGKPGTPAGLADILSGLQAELIPHMAKEELILFPLLVAGPADPRAAMAAGPIARMRAEHDDCGAMLEEVARVTSDLTLPAEACNSFRALYAGLAHFRDELTEHIHLENNVLFPPFEALVG
ncbi:MAG: iron-sulfur cluster repair di-iron protein [Acetobacteraceae bacterium]